MKVIKILGKKYEKNELEANSVIIRKWLACKQMEKVEIHGKYHVIENVEVVEKKYNELLAKAGTENKKFYEEYLAENWKNTFPIMRDVSSFEKIRPEDGVEFCILI